MIIARQYTNGCLSNGIRGNRRAHLIANDRILLRKQCFLSHLGDALLAKEASCLAFSNNGSGGIWCVAIYIYSLQQECMHPHVVTAHSDCRTHVYTGISVQQHKIHRQFSPPFLLEWSCHRPHLDMFAKVLR